MKTEIIPGILTHTVAEYIARLEMAEQSGSQWAHLDIMDGQFVQNITVMPHEVSGIPTTLKIEAHIMAEEPERYFSDLAVLGCQRVLLHRECYKSLELAAAVLRHAADYFPEVGLVINPETKVEQYAELPVHVIMCMGVHPGASGQALVETVFDQIKAVAAQKLGVPIEVDGGVNEDNLRDLQRAGADRFVINSQLYMAPNMAQQFSHFLQVASGGI